MTTLKKVVLFKHEDEVDGVAIGPARLGEVRPDGCPVSQRRPFDPERRPKAWVTRDEAEALAREHGVRVVVES